MSARKSPRPNQPRKWYRPRRSRRAQHWALGLVVVLLGGAAWATYGAYENFVAYPQRALGDSGEKVAFEIPHGSSLTRVLALLEEHEILAEGEGSMFKLYVLNEGAANKISAGPHEFRKDMTPTELLVELRRRPPANDIKVTIPEGMHSLQISRILADAGLADYESLVAATRDPALMSELGVSGENLDGYLFPDTYHFRRRADAEEIFTRLVKRHHQVFERVRRDHYEAAEGLATEFGWDQREIVTLASIVEKETGVKQERPHIARVFLNRLRFASFKPKRLETDPTIIYGCTVLAELSKACESFEGRIRRIHLRDPDNPYNTYTHEGLPPGPISNPGRAAIEAVFAPRRSRALFFVARNDGTHHFSDSRAEHEAAVDKYIRGGAVGDGKPQ